MLIKGANVSPPRFLRLNGRNDSKLLCGVYGHFAWPHNRQINHMLPPVCQQALRRDHLNVSTATSSCLELSICPNAKRKWSFPKRGPSPKREDTPLCARESNPKREVASTITLFGATPTSPHKIPKSPARLMVREVAALAKSMTPSTLRELGIPWSIV